MPKICGYSDKCKERQKGRPFGVRCPHFAPHPQMLSCSAKCHKQDTKASICVDIPEKEAKGWILRAKIEGWWMIDE